MESRTAWSWDVNKPTPAPVASCPLCAPEPGGKQRSRETGGDVAGTGTRGARWSAELGSGPGESFPSRGAGRPLLENSA